MPSTFKWFASLAEQEAAMPLFAAAFCNNRHVCRWSDWVRAKSLEATMKQRLALLDPSGPQCAIWIQEVWCRITLIGDLTVVLQPSYPGYRSSVS